MQNMLREVVLILTFIKCAELRGCIVINTEAYSRMYFPTGNVSTKYTEYPYIHKVSRKFLKKQQDPKNKLTKVTSTIEQIAKIIIE